MIYGLTYLGVIHTAISLVAVACGLIALLRNGHIRTGNTLGRLYIVTTVITCLTGFGIFQHGGFGKPHALGILTLIVLGVAWLAARRHTFGKLSPYVETVGYSTTFFFHMIPGVTETTTRLPLGKPLLPNADAPELQVVAGVLFLLLVVGATLQVLNLRSHQRGASPLLADEDEAPHAA